MNIKDKTILSLSVSYVRGLRIVSEIRTIRNTKLFVLGGRRVGWPSVISFFRGSEKGCPSVFEGGAGVRI